MSQSRGQRRSIKVVSNVGRCLTEHGTWLPIAVAGSHSAVCKLRWAKATISGWQCIAQSSGHFKGQAFQADRLKI